MVVVAKRLTPSAPVRAGLPTSHHPTSREHGRARLGRRDRSPPTLGSPGPGGLVRPWGSSWRAGETALASRGPSRLSEPSSNHTKSSQSSRCEILPPGSWGCAGFARTFAPFRHRGWVRLGTPFSAGVGGRCRPSRICYVPATVVTPTTTSVPQVAPSVVGVGSTWTSAPVWGASTVSRSLT